MNEDILYKKREIFRSAQSQIDAKIQKDFAAILPPKLQNLNENEKIKLPYSSILPKITIKKMIDFQRKLLKNEVDKPDNRDFNEVVFIKYENSIQSYVYVCRDGARYSVPAQAMNSDTDILKNKKLLYDIDSIKSLFMPAIRGIHEYQSICNQLQFNIILPIMLPREAILACGVYQKSRAAGRCIAYHPHDPAFVAAKRLIIDEYNNYMFIFYMLSGEVFINNDSNLILEKLKKFYNLKTKYLSVSQRAEIERQEKEKEEKEKKNFNRRENNENFNRGSGNFKKRYEQQRENEEAEEKPREKLPPAPSKISFFNEFNK